MQISDTVFSMLEKKDLKTLRMCSKALCLPVTKVLFRSVYFSVHKEDLEAYKGIMSNRFLRSFVKTIHYDVSGYDAGMTKLRYILCLTQQLWDMTYLLKEPFEGPDPLVNTFVNANLMGEIRTRAECARYKDFDFIKRGYRDWMRRARYEQGFQREDRFQTDKLFNVLVDGITRFDHLKSVVVRGLWHWDEGITTPSALPRQQIGSVVRCSWNPCQLMPCGGPYRGEPSDRDLTYFDSNYHFGLLNEALSITGTKLRSFKFYDDISPSVFAEAADHELLSKKAHLMKIVPGTKGLPWSTSRIEFGCSLEVLHLQFSQEDSTVRPYFKSNFLGLHLSLKGMPNLKTLDLWFPQATVIKYKDWFSKHGQWPIPSLTTFRFKGILEVHAHELADLLLISMPKLRHLTVGSIDLLTGKWKGMFELLMMQGHFESFAFYDESYLTPGIENYDFLGFFLESEMDDGDLRGAMKSQLSTFMTNGRKDNGKKHPCLEPMDPVADSSSYLLELSKDWQFNEAGTETPADRLLKSLINEISTNTRYTDLERWSFEYENMLLLDQ